MVDEFGGTSGMLTIEDIIEEIFGEIKDEHDTEEETEKDWWAYLAFSGRKEIDYLNKNYNLDIEIGDQYETLAGYILHKLEDIPEEDTSYETDHLIFTIKEVSEAKIELVQVRVK